MELKTKKLAIAALLMFALTSGVFLILPIVTAEETGVSTPNGEDIKSILEKRLNYQIWRRDTILMRFIKDGTYESLEGIVSAVTPRILVIQCDGQTVNVLMPGRWVFKGDTLNTQDLLDGSPFGLYDVVSLETLMLKLEKDDHTITSYLAFSITVGDDTATALLPFNVETE